MRDHVDGARRVKQVVLAVIYAMAGQKHDHGITSARALEYIDKGPSDWMTRYFFSGGIMPSADLPLRTSGPLQIDRQWAWNGMHSAKTCRA